MMKLGLRFSTIALIALIQSTGQAAEFINYQVRKGDNLVQILKRLGVPNPYSKQKHIEVARLNPETVQNEGALISAGSTIRIPESWAKNSSTPPTKAASASQKQVPKNLPKKATTSVDTQASSPQAVAVVDMSQSNSKSSSEADDSSDGGSVIALGVPGETPAAPAPSVAPSSSSASNDASVSGQLAASSGDALVAHQRLSVQPRYQWSRIEFAAPAYPEVLVLETNESYGIGLAMNWFRGGDWESSLEYSYRHANFKGPRGFHIDQEEQDLFQYRLEMAYYRTPFWRWALFSEGQQELVPHPISPATLSLDRTWQYRFGGRIGYQSALPGSTRVTVGLEAAAILPHSVERYQLDPTALLRADIGLGLPIHADTEWLFQLSYEGYQQAGPGFEHATQHLGALVSLSLKL